MKILKVSLFVFGLILLSLNICGFFKSLRNEELYSEITPYKDDISIPYSEVKDNLGRMKGESDMDFALRSSKLINHSMAHYWRNEGIKKYYMQVPLWENYVLSIHQRISGLKKYEFRNYKKVIERGVGICSQPCIALQYLLIDKGIKADLWDIKGHVVVEATFSDGTKFMLDPDYGNFVPYGMDEIQSDPELVRESYLNQDSVYAAHIKEHKHTDDIVKMYEKEGNHIYYMEKSFEDFSYVMIWVLPFILIFPFVIFHFKKRKR